MISWVGPFVHMYGHSLPEYNPDAARGYAMKFTCWRMSAVFCVCAATIVTARAQTFNTVVNFDLTDGYYPYLMALVQGEGGDFYGTTYYGGDLTCNSPYGCGTVFKMSPEGTVTTLHEFEGDSTDGAYPTAALARSIDGSFYGTTYRGGLSNSGTAFKITPDGMLTILHSFCVQFGCTDGGYPTSGLVQAMNGDFYGTTNGGGRGDGNVGSCDIGCGTIYKMTPTGSVSTLYDFCPQPGCGDGWDPSGQLIQATDGKFYGTTDMGGANGYGTVFKISSAGALTTLHSFDLTDGAYPIAGLVQAIDGGLYGTTVSGGSCGMFGGCGTVFKITTGGILTTLYIFQGGSDGTSPAGPLIQATDGNFYGTTCCAGDGSVFTMTSSGTLTPLHDFNGYDGTAPYCGLLQATSGTFYGTTSDGGQYNDGTVFSISTGLGPFVTFVRDAGKVGQTGPILGQGFTGTTAVSLSGTPAPFTVKSDTLILATVPAGATTGYVTVTTPSGMLSSNKPFIVIP